MAVFEKRKSMKVDLDDTHPLTCVIEAAQNVQTHIVSDLLRHCFIIPLLYVYHGQRGRGRIHVLHSVIFVKNCKLIA